MVTKESTWHYVIMRHTDVSGQIWYGLHEHYVLDGGEIVWTQEPSAPFGETPEELREDAILMLQDALKRPVLDFKTGKEV